MVGRLYLVSRAETRLPISTNNRRTRMRSRTSGRTLAYDERHRLVVSALFDLPIGEEEDRTPGEMPNAWVRAFSHIDGRPDSDHRVGPPGQRHDRRGRQPDGSLSVHFTTLECRAELVAVTGVCDAGPSNSQVLHHQAARETRSRDRSVQRAESHERHPGECRLRAASGITADRSVVRSRRVAARQFQFSIDFEF